ncbi:MAG: ATP-dependent Clp protease proteolytic subunit [Candidatus Nealsonbacteria bacterium]|nr:ATP-dependent Clp protease proteolytic subunit [Candidatus Nealsonbacteria bacterium]
MFTAPRRGGLNRNATMEPWEILAENRILYLTGPISGDNCGERDYDPTSPEAISQSMIILDSINHKPIKLVIDSPGGTIQDGLNFYNVMQCISSPVYTIGKWCASMAAVLFAAGAKGHRYIYPFARIMLHLPQGYLNGDQEEICRQVTELEKDKNVLVELLIRHGCARSKNNLLKDINKEFYLSNQDAVDYGVADFVITPAIHQELFGKLKIPSWQEALATTRHRG